MTKSSGIRDERGMWTKINSTLKADPADEAGQGPVRDAGARIGGGCPFEWNQDVARHLDEDAAWALTSNPTGAAEVAGVLLGRISTVEIVDCLPVLLMQEQDRANALSGPGKREFERAIAQFRSAPEGDLSVVGYYRTQLGGGLDLTEEDLGLIRGCFRETCQVTLLLHVTRDESFSARLFLGEDGRMVSEFHSAENATGLPRWHGLWKNLSGTNRAGTAPAAETLAPAEAGQPASTVPLANPPFWQTAEVEPEPVPSERRSLRTPLFVLAAVAVVAILVGYPMFRGPGVKLGTDTFAPTPAALHSSTPADAGLALHADKTGDALQLDWNRAAPMIANASAGVLTIQEGNAKEKRVMLDGSLLRTGSVVYRPVRHPVVVRLAIFDKDGTRLDESVTMYPQGRSAAVIHTGSDRYKETK